MDLLLDAKLPATGEQDDAQSRIFLSECVHQVADVLRESERVCCEMRETSAIQADP